MLNENNNLNNQNNDIDIVSEYLEIVTRNRYFNFDVRAHLLIELNDCNNKLLTIENLEKWNGENKKISEKEKEENKKSLTKLKKDYESLSNIIKKEYTSLKSIKHKDEYNIYLRVIYKKNQIDNLFDEVADEFPIKIGHVESKYDILSNKRLTEKKFMKMLSNSVGRLKDYATQAYVANPWQYNMYNVNYLHNYFDFIGRQMVNTYMELDKSITRCENIYNKADFYIEIAENMKQNHVFSEEELPAINDVIDYLKNVQSEFSESKKAYIDDKIEFENAIKKFEINDNAFEKFKNYKFDKENEQEIYSYIVDNINTLMEEYSLDSSLDRADSFRFNSESDESIEYTKQVSFSGETSMEFNKDEPAEKCFAAIKHEFDNNNEHYMTHPQNRRAAIKLNNYSTPYNTNQYGKSEKVNPSKVQNEHGKKVDLENGINPVGEFPYKSKEKNETNDSKYKGEWKSIDTPFSPGNNTSLIGKPYGWNLVYKNVVNPNDSTRLLKDESQQVEASNKRIPYNRRKN